MLAPSRLPHRVQLPVLLRLVCIVIALAAVRAYSQTSSAAPPGSTELRTGTQLVVVDVVVQDRSGHPVRNLPRDAFQVTESKKPQTVSAFEEHSTANPPRPGLELPKMPPGTFTDYTPVPAGGALNVLLIDALNTPMPDQSYLRDQLKQYVNSAPPGMRVAIFGLNTRLYLLQGFTSDLDTLKDAVNHKLIPRGSHLMDDPATGAPDTTLSDAVSASGLDTVAHDLQQFEAVEQSNQLQLRVQYTLDAFNALAHYLSAFPGRKNLLWFSGSFPINIMPDATLDNPFSVLQLNQDEFRETTGLLNRSQVAVYPIDARGLMTQPAFNAANSGSQYARNPAAFANDLSKFSDSQAQEHSTMEQLASDTGGRAFYNTNGLAAAAATAISTGSDYYTLAYTPTERNPHGEYRSIGVALSGAQAAAGLKLYYRHGYFAEAPRRALHPTETASAKPSTPAASSSSSSSSSAGTSANPAETPYGRAAMLHGAPAPQDILFKVRVLPVSLAADAVLTAEDHPDPAGAFKGPYRRYNIDLAALGSSFRLAPQPDGRRTGAAEFKTFVYDSEGKLLNVNTKTVQFNLTPETYKRMMASGIGMHLLISAPARGESFLRIGIHDLATNQYGVVEVPTASVSRLAPLPLPPAAVPPATPAATPQPASVPPDGKPR